MSRYRWLIRVVSAVLVCGLALVLPACRTAEPVTPAVPTFHVETEPGGVSALRQESLYAANLRVETYCVCSGPRDQAQVKVKVEVTNKGGAGLNVAADRFRIVILSKMTAGWTPPAPRLAEAESRESDRGTMLFIPPNTDGVHEVVEGTNLTWETHWDGQMLSPGATYFRPDAMKGDLVFYVPLGSENNVSLTALVLIGDSINDVKGFITSDKWGAMSLAGGF